MTNRLDMTAANGVPFRVVFLPEGKTFGTYTKWPEDSEPMVEFYDLRYTKNFGPDGQFVSRYHVDTILGRSEYGSGVGGIDLYGGVRDWSVDDDTMAKVRAWLEVCLPG